MLLTLGIVGATLVVALVGSRRLNASGSVGAHKGRPYTDRFGADAERQFTNLQVPLPYVIDDADQHLDRGADESLSLFRRPIGGIAVSALVG